MDIFLTGKISSYIKSSWKRHTKYIQIVPKGNQQEKRNKKTTT